MTQDLTKELVCILLRVGIEIWVEKERAEKLDLILRSSNCPQFIEYEGQLVNKSDISGIFNAKTMEERAKRKNGEWKCHNNTWHEKFQKCECLSQNSINIREEYYKKYGCYPIN